VLNDAAKLRGNERQFKCSGKEGFASIGRIARSLECKIHMPYRLPWRGKLRMLRFARAFRRSSPSAPSETRLFEQQHILY
jgi:hypothetical protein